MRARRHWCRPRSRPGGCRPGPVPEARTRRPGRRTHAARLRCSLPVPAARARCQAWLPPPTRERSSMTCRDVGLMVPCMGPFHTFPWALKGQLAPPATRPGPDAGWADGMHPGAYDVADPMDPERAFPYTREAAVFQGYCTATLSRAAASGAVDPTARPDAGLAALFMTPLNTPSPAAGLYDPRFQHH